MAENSDIKPQTIDAAILELLKAPDIKNLKDEDPASFHHFTGRWIRNSWGLWDPESSLHREFNAIGLFHADDMSGIIFETAHRILNKKPIDLPGQVNHYKKYWAKMGCDMKGNHLKGSESGE